MGHSNQGSHDTHVPHITPFSTYMKVFSALVVLTVITVAVAQVNLGSLNTLVAMFIATIKAIIVMMFFMHLKYESTLNKIVFASAFVFAFIFYILTAMDIFTRHNFQNLFINQ